MVVQVKHEAEVSRQHARYRIPARLAIEDREYDLNEWSVSGFSILGVSGDLSTWNPRRHGRMSFDLEGFELTLDLDYEILSHDPDGGLLRARFIDLSHGSLSVLHYIINAYLAGEVVTAGDVLHVAGRDARVKKNLDERLEESVDAFTALRQRLTRITGQAALAVLFALLVGFIGFKLFSRLYLVDAVTARVHGPVLVLRAPDNGVFETDDPEPRPTAPGDFLGMVSLIGGGAASVESPCACDLLEVLRFNGAFVGRGEPLAVMLPAGATLRIEAQIAFVDVAKVRLGHRATVRLADGTRLAGRVEALRSVDRMADVRALTLRDVPESIRTATVYLATEATIPVAMLDSVAAVTINTFGEPAGAGS